MRHPKSQWFLKLGIPFSWVILEAVDRWGSLLFWIIPHLWASRWSPNFRWFPNIKSHYISLHFRYISEPQVVTLHRRGEQLQRLVKDPYSSNVRISEDQKHGDILWNMKGKKFQIWWLISFCLAFRFLGLYRYTVYRYTQFSDMLTIAGDHSSQCIGAYHDNPWVGKT